MVYGGIVILEGRFDAYGKGYPALDFFIISRREKGLAELAEDFDVEYADL